MSFFGRRKPSLASQVETGDSAINPTQSRSSEVMKQVDQARQELDRGLLMTETERRNIEAARAKALERAQADAARTIASAKSDAAKAVPMIDFDAPPPAPVPAPAPAPTSSPNFDDLISAVPAQFTPPPNPFAPTSLVDNFSAPIGVTARSGRPMTLEEQRQWRLGFPSANQGGRSRRRRGNKAKRSKKAKKSKRSRKASRR
jgi:hypothetical protein